STVYSCCMMSFSFSFRAEDGIRDSSVTGVQTCALPISLSGAGVRRTLGAAVYRAGRGRWLGAARSVLRRGCDGARARDRGRSHQIGRASCRERVKIEVVAAMLKRESVYKPRNVVSRSVL